MQKNSVGLIILVGIVVTYFLWCSVLSDVRFLSRYLFLFPCHGNAAMVSSEDGEDNNRAQKTVNGASVDYEKPSIDKIIAVLKGDDEFLDTVRTNDARGSENETEDASGSVGPRGPQGITGADGKDGDEIDDDQDLSFDENTGQLDINGGGDDVNIKKFVESIVDASTTECADGEVLQWSVAQAAWECDTVSPSAIPFISTDDAQKVIISTPTTITITGENFTPTSAVAILGFDGTIDSVNILSPTEMEITLTPGTVEAFYDIVISNDGVLNTQWAMNGENLVDVADATILTPGDGTTAWVRESANIATSLGKLVTTTTGSGWNRGASFGTVPAATDFELEFNPVYMAGRSSGGYAMIGVDNADPNTNYNTIDYAIYLQNGVNLYVYENGLNRGNRGTWTVSDTFKVRRTGTTIEYLKNDVVFYTSTIPSSAAMVFDSSLYRYLGAENITMTY